MTTYEPYRYALGLTSQFYFCGLPLRLDSYSNCLFSCRYCFAAARGGSRSPRGLKVARAGDLQRQLERTDSPQSAIGELLAHRQPIHFGGMSDPFPPLERKLGASLRLLEVLADQKYPTVISTKGTLIAEEPYMSVLKGGNFVVQFSFSTRSADLARDVDFGVPSPQQRLNAMTTILQAGIPAAARLQPLIPGLEDEARDFIDELGSLGVPHVGIEYLKMPLEGWAGSTRLGEALATDLARRYAPGTAIRQGREWILPVETRLPAILDLRARAHANGMSFGAADSDLLPLSDGSWCCSGADGLLSDGAGFEFNYLGAVRRASNEGLVTYAAIEDCWAPQRSVAMMINSNSRLPAVEGRGAGVRDYIRTNWNGRANGCSPAMFYGVHQTAVKDEQGLQVYQLTEELRGLLSARSGLVRQPSTDLGVDGAS